MLFPPEIIEHTSESYFAQYSKATSILYISVLLALFAAGAVTPFIKVDITTQSRGIIRSSQENNTIQAAVYAKVQKVFLHENQTVNAGDTLVVLCTHEMDAQMDACREKMIQNQRFIDDIEAIIRYESQWVKTPKYFSEYNEYLARLKQQQMESEFLLHEKEVSDKLYFKKVETEMDHEKAVNNYNIALKKEKLIHDQYHKQWNASLAQYQTDNLDLKATIARMEKQRDQYFIVAPVDGTVIQYSGIKEGNFIVPNQLLAEISPDAGLLVECYVSPSDIGFLKQGMNVHYQLDAFNYNQWGMAYGTVKDISDDIVTVNDQAVFKIRCSLDKNYLQLKNGYRGELKKGMTLTGRFALTRRTVWQLLFDKVDNWLNPKLAET